MSSRRYLTISAIIAIAIGVRIGLAANEDDRQPDQTSRLTQKIKALEARVEALERANIVRALPADVSALPPDLHFHAPLIHPQEVPPNWTSHEFNGMTYYLVPLGKSGHEESR
jgi:hypothetical protein